MVQTRASTSVQINGPALRAIRQLVGVSCALLAREVGTDVSFLARVERGEKRGVGRETFARLVAALEIDPRAIMVAPYVTGAIGTGVSQSGPTVVPLPCRTCKPRSAA